MSETPWTPGPWDVYPLDLRGGRYWSVKPGIHEAIDIHEDDNGEANARLIAAAPELLQACKAALISMIDDSYYQEFKPVIDTLEAAIAKAEGRS